MKELLLIAIGSALVNNVVLSQFLGLCPFLGVSKKTEPAGILFAPEKGTETRDKIAEALRKRGIKLNRKEMDSLVDEIADEIKSAEEV